MPLQKSFSDQNHSSKARQQRNRAGWSRNNSYHGRDSSRQTSQSKPLQEKPPLPVSTATKTKLSNFLAQPNNEAAQKSVISLLSDDDKENSESNSRREDRLHKKSQRTEQEAAGASPLPNLPKKYRTPSTPAGRLALPDLIGMSDVQRAVETVSPDDRIQWDHREDDRQEGPAPFSGSRRTQKRARSSSPIPSPHANGENPQLDPGSELWGRYSLNGFTVSTPQGPSVPALAHLMQTSSPQPSKDSTTPRSVPGLRRSTSCGTSFPKRRRVGDFDGDVFTEPVRIGPSRLSVLIERIQEDILQPKLSEPNAEFSSSTNGAYGSALCSLEDTSPTGYKESRLAPLLQCIPRTRHPTPENSVNRRQERQASVSNSSDYGDFDDGALDASVLKTLDFQSLEVSTKDTPLQSNLPPKYPCQPRLSPRKAQLPVPFNEESFDTLKDDDDDEFGEFDDDAFGDLEEVVSQFDRQAPPSKPQKVGLSSLQGDKVPTSIDSDDEFGDDGIDEGDFEAAVAAPQTQPKSNDLLPTTRKVQAIQRYLVCNVFESEYEDETTRRICKEQVLHLAVEGTKITMLVNLRGFWYLSPVTEKAYVHVIGDFVGSRCIIDNNHNMLILHPDHLVSSTVVADSFSCTRRAVLQDRVKATGDAAPPMVYGTILHEIFQAAMVANRWDTEYLNEVIEDITTKHVQDLYTIRIQITDAIQYLQSKIGELQSWAQLFISSQPNPEAIVKDRHGETANMCVSKLLDVEEHVWSPMYGLKGNIDATVQVTMQDTKSKEQRTLTVPLEVKTGKTPNASHRAQTALYNLLISDRYDMEVAYGILYYMETSETIRIPKFRNELIHMIMKRNELACFVRERNAELPDMEKKENLCGRCFAKVPCFIYHRLADDGTGETSGVGVKFDEVVKHLTPKHKQFFLKWDDLLTKEEKESMKFRRELWTMLSSEREKLGRCFSNVVIEPGSGREDLMNAKINRFTYTMNKQEALPGFSFLESQIIVGEPIVISDEKGHFALANGYVTKVSKGRITVTVDRRLHNSRIRQCGFNDVNNQVFSSIMQVGMPPNELTQKPQEQPIKYRLDKDEFSNGMATVRNNLIQIMADGPYGSRQIRGLVVDLNAPRFKTKSTAYVLQGDEGLNEDQKAAIQKVMSAEDYALVLGMPGTGKTTTIAHIIRALVSQGKSILLTSYTHSAVDNILLKLKDDNIRPLRLGNIAKIHPDVQKFANLAATTKVSFEEIKSAWHDTPVVATTCLGVNHAIFNERTFDYCIVDEASQITLPVCLGPIRLAKTFILVGDHNQLPPLVQNEEARVGGLDISLFKHLSDAQPSSVVYLEHQYRMCKDVMTLSNDLIYQGRLKCGNDEVANRKLVIPNMDGIRIHHFSPSTLSRSQRSICTGPSRGRCWIRDVLDPATSVAFLNSDTLLPGAREQAKGNRIVNPTEATICTQVVESLLSTGVEASSIGVMTHYRSQLSLLKHNLRHHVDVEMHTADRFQGRDKEVIILSLVRSNEARSIGELLKDWRRINVAFTRAKTKLLVIGSRETLKGNGKDKDGNDKEEMIGEFIRLLEVKNWIYDLPKTALEDHYFEEGGTQATAASRPNSTQFEIFEEGPKEADSGKKKAVALGEGKENRGLKNGTRVPNKKTVGQKPFKIPRQSVLADIYNEALG